MATHEQREAAIRHAAAMVNSGCIWLRRASEGDLDMRGRRQNPAHTAAKRDAACPTCGANAGESCRKTKGGIAWPPHKARVDALASREERQDG